MGAQSYLTLCDPMDCILPGSSIHGDFLGKNTGVGCCFLLQGIFKTQGLNPHLLHLLHWQVDYLSLCHIRKPMYTLVYIKQIAYKNLLYSTGNSTQYSVMVCMRKESEKQWIYVFE